ncbi:urease accessory UreF family protein [Nonomuraea sp. NPDC050478]|uniref:urease accessory UreF family protein n=1 Tax=Nonomuraea sp. NPDC050478 TaxID=3364365 RepID=UPI00378E146F
MRFSWELLDAEADARTASPAQREAARLQGRLLLRVARRLWPSPVLDELAQEVPSPHHPIALGAAAHAARATPGDAALAAAYHAITGPATAAVRLLGLDPVAVHGILADLTPDLTALAEPARTKFPQPNATTHPKPPGTKTPEPTDTGLLRPHDITQPEPGATEIAEPAGSRLPQPQETTQPKPGAMETPEPADAKLPKPNGTARHEPDATGTLKQAEAGLPEPRGIGTTQLSKAGLHERGGIGTPEPPEAGLHEPGGIGTFLPSTAGLHEPGRFGAAEVDGVGVPGVDGCASMCAPSVSASQPARGGCGCSELAGYSADPGVEEGGWAALGAPSAPGLDLLAERHAHATVRLFVS